MKLYVNELNEQSYRNKEGIYVKHIWTQHLNNNNKAVYDYHSNFFFVLIKHANFLVIQF
jgi:hypothetical protein